LVDGALGADVADAEFALRARDFLANVAANPEGVRARGLDHERPTADRLQRALRVDGVKWNKERPTDRPAHVVSQAGVVNKTHDLKLELSRVVLERLADGIVAVEVLFRERLVDDDAGGKCARGSAP
jgi:hypothetical protein